jgi:hypothetical protein
MVESLRKGRRCSRRMSGVLIYCLASKLVRSHFLRNIIALRSSAPLPTSLGSFPYNIHCPARLCSLCQSRQENLDDYMRLVSSSSPSPSDEDKLSHSLLEGHFPPTRSIPSSSIRIGGPICSTKNQHVCTDLILPYTSSSSGTCFILTDQLDGRIGSCA